MSRRKRDVITHTEYPSGEIHVSNAIRSTASYQDKKAFKSVVALICTHL